MSSVENSRSFILSRDDWSLHRKGQDDQERHQEKVEKIIRERIGDLTSDESIITSQDGKPVRIPVRSIEQYRFRYNHNKQEHVGTGKGDRQIGDPIANAGSPQQGNGQDQGQGKGNGQGAGDGGDGGEWYEVEVSLEEIENVIFDDLELPNLDETKKQTIITESTDFTEIRKKGIMANLDKKRTIFEAMKRNLRKTGTMSLKISEDDLRFKTWEEKEKPSTSAVVIAMMDTSGSMGTFEKYCSRAFFFWTTRFLRKNYPKVEIVFIAHHTEAKEVSEEQFFTRGESGGTICSSAFKLANKIISERYRGDEYNVYAYYVSDGDNLTSDNPRLEEEIIKMSKVCNQVGYVEINQYNRHSTLMNLIKGINEPNFKFKQIMETNKVIEVLRTFFGKVLK